jgi:hypothetical protein
MDLINQHSDTKPLKIFLKRNYRISTLLCLKIWEDNIKIDLRAVGLGGMDWINLAEDRERWRALVSAVMNLRVP